MTWPILPSVIIWLASCQRGSAVDWTPTVKTCLVLFAGLGDSAGLVDRVGHRLFAVDVLARLHGVDGHLGVPVVGRGDQDSVDVLAIEEPAVVLGDAVLVLALGRRGRSFLAE